MQFSFPPHSIFLSTLLDYQDPKNNGCTAFIVYGINISNVISGVTISKLSLRVSSETSEYPGYLVSARKNINEHLNIEDGKKILVLTQWKNIKDIYGVSLDMHDPKDYYSAIFSIRTRNKNIFGCNKIHLTFTLSTGEEKKYEFPFTDFMKDKLHSTRYRITIA